MRIIRDAPLLLLAVLATAAWTGEGAPGNIRGEAGTEGMVLEVRMIDTGGNTWRFEPSRIEVEHGDVVRFVQDDIVPHNVQFKAPPAEAELGALVMGPFLIQKGATYEVTIDERFAPGEYPYVCTPHEALGMVATLVVASADE